MDRCQRNPARSRSVFLRQALPGSRGPACGNVVVGVGVGRLRKVPPFLFARLAFFTGQTLDQYLSGIGQGFQAGKEVESTGGWINAGLKATSNMSFNAGIGIDQPKKDDKAAFPTRNSNMSVYANMFTKVAQSTTFAVEISHWTTGYWDAKGKEIDRSSLRLQASFIYSLN